MLLLALLVSLAAAACRNEAGPDEIKGNAIIDWVDFVMLDGRSYNGLYDGVIVNPEDITEQVAGKTKFKLSDVVSNPGYRTKDGDAAFLPIGTKLYRVKGFEADELIAARDEKRIGGYRLYAENEFYKTVQRHYEELPKDKTERIELYRIQEFEPYKTLLAADMDRFIQLLDTGKDTDNYTPPNREKDPDYYRMVFYTDEPIAHSFTIADDGTNVFFSPWTTRIVDPAVRTLLQP
jgi:hypothetical protein